MELFGKIREEHEMLITALDKLVGASTSDYRADLDDFAIWLTVHMNAEEESIYTAFEDLDPVPRSLAIRHDQEHHLVRYMLTELKDKMLNDEVRAAKLEVLRFLIEHHFDSEERAMFDMARDYFTDDQIGGMTEAYGREEKKLLEAAKVPLSQ